MRPTLYEHRLQPGPAHGQAGGRKDSDGQRTRPQDGCPPHGRIIARDGVRRKLRW